MTYQLAALRFRSIGERSARFTDLTLDLTAPADDMIAPHDSVVWLRNGGGKSSILSLLYAMLLPAANDFMGRAVQRSLTDYIDTGDTSHIVAVWQPRGDDGALLGDPAEALITGAVHEWADLRRPAQAARARERLTSWFYACHVVPGVLELGSLPFTDADHRPLRLAAYLDALRELARRHTRQASLALTEKQYVWAKVLDDRHLDPEIFRTQKQMNHVEGGVEDLFKFRSAREFIDFLLDLTTQPDDANSLAQRLESVTALLAAKPHKLVERDFCLAAAEDLTQVADHHRRLGAARSELAARTADAARLAASFLGTATEAEAEAAGLQRQRDTVQQELSRANTDKSSANDLAYLYSREAARLRVGEAKQRAAAADDHVTACQRAVRAWELAQRLAQLQSLRAELDQAELAAAAEEEELAPLRAERDRHAAALRRRLLRLAEAAESEARRAEADRRSEIAQAEEHESLAEAASGDKDQATSDATRAETALQAMTDRLRAGVGKGHLPSDTTDLGVHRADLERERAEHHGRLQELRGRQERRRRRRAAIAARDTELAQASSDAAGDRERILAQVTGLTARLAELTSSARLRDLAEATADEPIDLWGEGSTLLRRLEDAVIAADNERILRRAEQHADRRTIEGQERDSVLPTSLDAERIERALTEIGIAAESGWSHLREVLPAERLLAALDLPEIARLGCGVVVPTGSVTDAVRFLDSQSTVTTSLVHVHSAEDVDTVLRTLDREGTGTAPAWGRLEPGLVDPDLAESAVRLLKERAKAYALKDKELTARRAGDDDLRRSLESFLTDCPTGHLELLGQETERLDARLGEIEREQRGNRAELQTLDDADVVDDGTRERSDTELLRLAAIIAWVDELIPVLAQRPTWLERKKNADDRVIEADRRGRRHATEAVNARLAAAGHQARAAADADTARDRREEAAGLSIDASAATDAEDDPAVTLDALRQRWQSMEQDLHARAAQSVLAYRVQRLTSQVSMAMRELGGVDAEERSRAAALLTSPDGQEPALRTAALERARAGERAALDERGGARSQVGEREKELAEVEKRHRQQPRRALPQIPRIADEADALATEQETLAQQAQERATRAENLIAEIGRRADHATARADAFGTLLDLLPAPSPAAEAPFSGDREAARAAARNANQHLTAAESRRADEEGKLNEAVDVLRRTAGRFSGVTGPIKDRVANDPVTVLAPHAEDLADRLRLRAQTLTGELTAIAKDQEIISDGLAHLVKESFDMLGRAERASRMPTTYGSWAGKKVLRITFDRPDDADLTTYAERVIDQLIDKGLRPEGMPLLKAALHEAAGPRGFTVKVLKPSEDQISTTEDISRLAKWSGGEKLTVCVALYCTLAALRAARAGRRGRSGGVLLLDNPIGRASSAPLVRLQRDVAAAHGVQLVYTTGVKDPAAVIQFPNIIRLDNREGRTRNRRFIVAEEETASSGNEVVGVRVAHTDHVWDALPPSAAGPASGERSP